MPPTPPAADRLRELAETLAGTLPATLPARAVRIERARGLAAVLGGRPARLTCLEVRDGALTLRLEESRESEDGEGAPPLVPWVVRTVHGVVISRRRVPLRRWLAQLERTLHGMSQETSRAEAAAHRLLVTLGAADPSAGIGVDDELAGLSALAGRLEGRVPPDVQDTVRRIAELLRRAVPGADDESQEWLLRRIATDYLPTTLRVYLDLPGDWTDPQQVARGRTPLDLLRDQLAVLESGAHEIYQATLADDAGRLLANGAFLLDRFGSRDTPLALDGTAPPGPPRPPAPARPPALASRRQVAALFRMLDVDQDGSLSASELSALMGDLGEPLDAGAVRLLLDAADSDHDGRITLTELVDYLAPGAP